MAFFGEKAAGMDAGIATLALIYSLILTAIVIMTGVLSVTRFYNNLLGTEGYLMFSLPAGTGALIAAKMLSAVFWSFMSIFAGMLSALVFALTYALPHLDRSALEELRKLFYEIAQRFRLEHLQGIGVTVLFLLAGICAVAGLLARVYAALAIGHQWSNHRILGAVLAFLGLEIAEGWARIFLIRAGVSTFLPSLLDGFDGSSLSGMTMASLGSIAISLAVILLYGVITTLLLDRRLNLE
jgi:hypothetical protein